jgi:hypothetical protein
VLLGRSERLGVRAGCVFGHMDCPGGAQFCAEPVCVCNAGFTGQECSTPVPEGITATEFLRQSAKAAEFRSKRNDSAPPETCANPPVCENGGKLNKEKCACECPESFAGTSCQKCSSRPCAESLTRSSKSCNCVCALQEFAKGDAEVCLHGGEYDRMGCRCKCSGSWTGPRCNVCLPQDCAHGGVWDPEACSCKCPEPWSTEDNCATCPVQECVNGEFDAGSCSCKCRGHFQGPSCDQCPSLQELELRGVSCGHRGFDRAKCACRDICPPIDCLHGGTQDPDSCECTCNANNVRHMDHHQVEPMTKMELIAPNSSLFLQLASRQPVEPATEPVADAPAEPVADAPAEPVADAPAEPVADAPAEPVADAPAEPVADAPAEPMADAPAEPGAAATEPAAGASAEADARASWVPAVPLTAAQIAVTALTVGTVSTDTFWQGERCEVCQPPADLETQHSQRQYPYHLAPRSCPPAHTFNMTSCACQPICPIAMCENGGIPVLLEQEHGVGPVRGGLPVLDAVQQAAIEGQSASSAELIEQVVRRGAFRCGCQCRPPWSGDKCDVRASGATPISSARSCLAILRTRPGAGSGRYWINPSGVAPLENAFQVFCDMNEDGGGWTEIARVGQSLSTRLLDANSYHEGAAVGGGQEFILPCGRLNGLDGSKGLLRRFVLRMSIGKVRDYFRPSPMVNAHDGSVSLHDLCEVLSSHDKHLWSPFFRRTMLDGSEALILATPGGHEQVIVEDTSRGHLAENSSSPMSEPVWETPVMVKSLDAAQFRQRRSHAIGRKHSSANQHHLSPLEELSHMPVSPSSAQGVFDRIMSMHNPRFLQAHLTLPSASAASSRLMSALVGPDVTAQAAIRKMDTQVADTVRAAGSEMRFAKARTDADPVPAWMRPPSGFVGPFGTPPLIHGVDGPSMPGSPVSSAMFVNSAEPVPGMLPASLASTPQLRPNTFQGDGLSTPPAVMDQLAPGPSSQLSLVHMSDAEGQPVVGISVQHGLQGAGPVFQRPGGPRAPVMISSGEMSTYVFRGSGDTASPYGKTLPPASPVMDGFSTWSADPNSYRFRQKFDRSAEQIKESLSRQGLKPIVAAGEDSSMWGARVAGARALQALASGGHPGATSLLQAAASAWQVPSEGEASAAPVEGEASAAPVEGEASAAPVEGEASAAPVEGETSAAPVEGETIAAPVEGETSAAPVEGEASAAPAALPKTERGVAHNPSGWVRPAYIDSVMNPQLEGVLGGSRKGWPEDIDGRMYVSFWGGNRGGCCHESSENYGEAVDAGGWAKEFRLHVMEVDPVLYAKGNDFDFRAAESARFKDESDPMEGV